MANENKTLQQSNGSENTNAGDKQICGDENENGNKLNDLVADLCTSTTTSAAAAGGGDYMHREDNIYTLNSSAAATTTTQQQTPAQNSTFSFKHFLNSTTTAAAPTSSIVVTLDTQTLNAAEVNSTTNVYVNSLRTSTGARPKVPQSSSASATSISSLIGSSSQDSSISSSSAIKMKRSPRFSSFDSQASLAEHASNISEAGSSGAIGGVDLNNSRHIRMYPGGSLISENNDWFINDYEHQQFVPRSISNYDMPVPPSSPRRAMRGNNAARDGRPNRLQSYNNNSSKLRLDLPIENIHSNNAPSCSRSISNNANEFGPTSAGAAGLPDFVQDHWMVSPPNSPICDIIDDSVSISANAQSNMNSAEASSGGGGGGAKMLPDFLSDGPIIHSSQRWADVTVGLPSDSFCSPETSAMSMQLSQLRIDNERLQFELTESRIALDEQTKRANNLETQLQRERKENLATDKNKQRSSSNEVGKLKQQIVSLTTQMETLRRENDLLREDGAVGGCNSMKCDRQPNNSNEVSAENVCRTQSRRQQISRDLLQAAETAENNLRQLLSGVDNLRQMAADIGNSEARLDDASPDIYSDYLDDLDEDFNENQGGPAL